MYSKHLCCLSSSCQQCSVLTCQFTSLIMSHGGRDRSSEGSICSKRDLRTRTTRQSNKDNWIQCDCCKLWFHSSCGGFTASEHTTISKDSVWLKCCTQHILVSQSEEEAIQLTSAIIESAKSRQHQSTIKLKGGNKKNGKDSLQTSSHSTPSQRKIALSNSSVCGAVKRQNTDLEITLYSTCITSSDNPLQDNITGQQNTSLFGVW